MGAIMRRTMRGTAAGLGALAIVAGTAACGGLLGGDGEGGDPPAAEEPADDGDAAEGDAEGDSESDAEGESEAEGEAAGSEESEGSDEEDASGDAAGELAEEDLSAAGDRFSEFFSAVGDGDAEAACGVLADPATGKPFEGERLEECTTSFEESIGEDFDPAMADVIDRSMIEAVDNGDGTAGITLMGEDSEMTMTESDGEWYLLVEGDL